ncbi:MAG TPA: response regulator [Acidobacteriota bacterium]|nr:response regulator [Acidobacteriota bacterium]
MARILVVDDDPGLRNSLCTALQDLGHVPFQAGDGLEGLTCTDPTDLVITDLCMPRVGGLELIRSLRHRRPALPIIAISGDSSAGDRLETARRLGAVTTLRKPFGLPDLVREVERALSPLG